MRTERDDSPYRLLFEVEGKPRRRGLRKVRSYVAFFENAVVIELDGVRDRYEAGDIYDIFVKEPVVEDVTSRTVELDFVEEGDANFYELEEETFPGLAALVEQSLTREWSHILRQWDYPVTVNWFLACCAVVQISSERNWRIFGSPPLEARVTDDRRVLYESWGFHNGRDLVKMLPKLLAGRAVKKWRKQQGFDPETVLTGEDSAVERRLWAWDLQRLIWLANLGLACQYLTKDEAFEWCLHAAAKLQPLFSGWDEFMDAYLRSYAEWADEDLTDPNSEAFCRAQIYQHYTRLPVHPWQVSWDQPLARQW
ncbi:MAG: DUF1266 domain-containing protein [Propionibacteriaceae bacterium]|jgi:hypothetical protein|nr:DUF1266 domain-containing protein [Propionibacteriaceae bacterium]